MAYPKKTTTFFQSNSWTDFYRNQNVSGLLILVTLIMTGLTPLTEAKAADNDPAFRQWINRFWPTARRAGIKRSTYDRAFRGIRINKAVIKAAKYQPEFTRPIWEYVWSATSDTRVTNGQTMLKKHGKLLDSIEKRYGVSKYTVLAIWGMESNYGEHQGKKYVIEALATLAYRGRRRRFGRQQLIGALKILQRGDISADKMTGSWAGAMGHTQFIPTTYNAYAVDFDGDGKRDIWTNIEDALASTANYLRRSGWKKGQTWGYEVELPIGFNHRRAGRKKSRRISIARWKKLGVRRMNLKTFPRMSDKANLVLPSGSKGPAFLMIRNFRSILRYNNATAYALSVGHLADKIAGGGQFLAQWPTKDRPLPRSQRLELQKLLAHHGFEIEKVDGILGRQTRKAVRAYQKSRGLVADGHPNLDILKSLRKEG